MSVIGQNKTPLKIYSNPLYQTLEKIRKRIAAVGLEPTTCGL